MFALPSTQFNFPQPTHKNMSSASQISALLLANSVYLKALHAAKVSGKVVEEFKGGFSAQVVGETVCTIMLYDGQEYRVAVSSI
jgi:hypothetical protein